MTELETLPWWFAVIVGVLSIARTARLLAWDEFPPVDWLRVRLIAVFGDRWGKVWTCQFCLAPYLTIGMIGWAWLSDLHWTWWLINGWWAASYVAAILVAYDQPE